MGRRRRGRGALSCMAKYYSFLRMISERVMGEERGEEGKKEGRGKEGNGRKGKEKEKEVGSRRRERGALSCMAKY